VAENRFDNFMQAARTRPRKKRPTPATPRRVAFFRRSAA
jgi:hypothetical protein